ncbi:MAG: hypothetical protein LKI34_03015 [Bifidobacterium tibiigranuli]|jgi:predicted DNA-binding transcriptional regulator YafY|uniref:hypothetical protein n=1 Tax=Bifidobacterium tibiigranuli TaxID=2172043 RepID=UPI0026EE7FCE|nr:hypothetical protein [Bifidobacterium tibiigranuli]MCI1673178.1 hypothetical protein [Bifidobacterium tibiigranuli]MCI1713577.1 hypothetical protein [Bifidobacterium tibiigranuli]
MSNEIIHVETSNGAWSSSSLPKQLKVSDISLTRDVKKISVSAWQKQDRANSGIVMLKSFADDGVSLTPDEADAVADVIHSMAATARQPAHSERIGNSDVPLHEQRE